MAENTTPQDGAVQNVALALMALQLAKLAVPVLQDAFKSGEVTIERQKEVLDAYNALSNDLDAAFSGPQWQIEPDAAPAPEGSEQNTA